MSAPDTNLETQAHRHAGPLTGMRLALTFAGALLLALITWTVFWGGEPTGAEEQIDGRTGAVEETAPAVVVTE